MTRTKKIVVIVASVVFITAAAVAVLWYQGLIGNGDRRLWRLVKDQPELLVLYTRAKEKEAAIAKRPEEAALYFDEGLDWKSIAERISGNQNLFFKRSLGVYESGIGKFGDKNILFYLNAGNLAVHIADYAKAETYYKKAMAISPGDESGYLSLVDLYVYQMKKSKDEILAVFAEGMKRMFNPVPLIAGRASYLRRVGDREAALADYKVLSANFPNHPGYKEIVKELEQPPVSQ